MNESGVGTSLSAERFLTERVDDQLRWYGDGSTAAKRCCHRLQIATLELAASGPVLSLSPGDIRMRILVGTGPAARAPDDDRARESTREDGRDGR